MDLQLLILVVGASLSLQIAAAARALRLIRLTGRYRAWLLVVAGLSFMAIRRVLVLQVLLLEVDQAGQVSLLEELVALATSACMAGGIIFIRPVFLDLHRSAEELMTSQERYRSIFESSQDGILVTSRAGDILAINPAGAQLLGYEQKETAGLHIREILPDAGARGDFQRALEEAGSLRGYEMTLRGRHGLETHCEVTASLSYAHDGTVAGYQGILRDITSRKQMQEALLLSEEKFSKAFKSSPVWIMLSTLEDGRLIEVNEAFLLSTGYAHEEVLGRTSLELGMWVDPGERQRGIDEIREQGMLRNLEVHRRTKLGQVLVVLWSAEKINLGGEEILLSIYLDISERQKAEAALKRSEERHRLLLEALPDPIVVYDMAGRATFVNVAFCETFGWSAPELIGSTIPYVPKQSGSQVEDAVRRMDGGQKIVSFDAKRLTKDGRTLDIQLSASCFEDAHGNPVGNMVILRDVTMQKQMERQLMHAQKMEALGRLAGGVAHDFNNLLLIIKGYSDLAISGTKDALSLRSHIEKIKAAGEKGSRLIKQLLTLSHHHTQYQGAVDLNALVNGLDDLLRPLIPENVIFSTDIAPDLSLVRGEAGQVEQVVMNLVVNALDAMPQGGRLHIGTCNKEVVQDSLSQLMELSPGSYSMITVSDTGCGMDAKTISHIFEPFFTTKEAGKGTGLGLSVVYGILKKMGGGLSVYSEPGQGTTFKVYLPHTSESTGQAVAVRSQPARVGGQETILLVEDDAEVRALISETLRLSGYQVLEAGEGDEAISLASGHQGTIHLIISDVIMPGLSGPQLVRELANLHSESRVLFMSGYTESNLPESCYAHANAGFMQKPFSIEELHWKLREMLD